MPNTKDVSALTTHKILILGDTGSGKTTQILTLPGRRYVHVFDQNALHSLRGADIEYDAYMPDVVGTAATSLSKGKGDRSAVGGSDSYRKFEQEFNERLVNGFYSKFDWICFDGATTLLDLVMDRVLTINGRYGQWPQQDDYGPVMMAFTNICRNVTSMGKSIYFTGHLETKQDDLTKKIQTRPMMTGRLVQKIPLLFSDIFASDVSLDDKGKPAYRIQTIPDGIVRTIRCSIKGLEPYENVTIDFSKPVEGQGLGGILAWEARQPKVISG